MPSTNFKLYTITFIDSLCLAFLPPIMAAHVMSLGGNHTCLGILGTLHTALLLFSGPLIHSCKELIGKKLSLLLLIFIYFIVYYYLGVTTSYVVFIGLRVIFALTNQTQSICKSIVDSVNPAETIESVNNLMNIVGVAGLIIAPIISSIFFDYLNFYYVTVTASLILLLSFGISFSLPLLETTSKETTSLIKKLDQDVFSVVRNFMAVDFKKCNYLILLKALYMISLTQFFIKFSYALKFNQGISFTLIGLTYAYQSLVTFLSTFFINYFITTLDNNVLLRWLWIIGISLGILSNTQSYILYLVSFVMMIVAHGVITRLFKELFAQHKISAVEETITKMVLIIIPPIFGIACDLYGLTAYNAFVVLPIFCAIFIVYAFLKITEDDRNKGEPEKSKSEHEKAFESESKKKE